MCAGSGCNWEGRSSCRGESISQISGNANVQDILVNCEEKGVIYEEKQWMTNL